MGATMTICSSSSDGARKRGRRALCCLTATVSMAAIAAYIAAAQSSDAVAQGFPGGPQVPGTNPGVPGVPGVPTVPGRPNQPGRLEDSGIAELAREFPQAE